MVCRHSCLRLYRRMFIFNMRTLNKNVCNSIISIICMILVDTVVCEIAVVAVSIHPHSSTNSKENHYI